MLNTNLPIPQQQIKLEDRTPPCVPGFAELNLLAPGAHTQPRVSLEIFHWEFSLQGDSLTSVDECYVGHPGVMQIGIAIHFFNHSVIIVPDMLNTILYSS